MRATLLFVLLWVNGFSVGAQVLSVSQHKSCEGNATTFYIDFPKAVKTYQKAELIFDDGQSVDLLAFHNPKVHHYYYNPGLYTPVLKLTEIGQAAQSFTTNEVEILKGPEFKMLLSGKDSQCYAHNHFTWQGPWKSASGSELIKWEWDFGDGLRVNKKNPNHSYSSPGNYAVSLTCRDEQGCEQTQTRQVTVHDSFSVRFIVNQDSVTSGTIIEFTNLSTIDSLDVASWVWDWGVSVRKKDTFTFDSTVNLWNGVKKKYSRDGFHSPKLVVTSKNNCKDSFLSKDRIRIVDFRFNISWFSFNDCFSNNEIYFSHTPRHNATELKWSFRDSLDIPRTNYNSHQWSLRHHYTQPGYYNVNLEILEHPSPPRDTTVCFVKVKGPMAKILRNKKRNSHIPIRAIESYEYEKIKQDIHYRLRSGNDSIRYWRIKKVKPFVVDSVAEYVNAPMQVSKEIESVCQRDTIWRPIYTLEPTSYRKVFQDYVLLDSGYWKYQSPIPTETLYHPPSGKRYMHNMHDTDLYHPAPFNMVQFSNNSVKYRLWGDSLQSQKPPSLRYAWDNVPGEFPDKGRNPNYPWASDSLEYFWNFRDPTAQQCTSTVANPNVRCAYSTEVAPRHLYHQMGVYHAILGVTDLAFNCSDSDTVTIMMAKPNLIPEHGKVFNWYQQDRFDSLNKDVNLGFRIRGKNCVNPLADQKLDFSELGIDPDHIDNYWVVFDADEQCDTVFYSFDTKNGIRDSFFLDCDWISKKQIEANKSIYNYQTGGWKSIGVVLKNGNAFDTLFIKNYKWLHHPKMQVKLNYDIKPLTDSFELKMTAQDSTSMHDSIEVFQFFISSLQEDSYGNFFDSLKFPEGKDTTMSTMLSTTGFHRISWQGISNRNQHTCHTSAPLFLSRNTEAYFNVVEQNVCVNENIKFAESIFYYKMVTTRSYRESRARNDIYDDQWTEYRRLERWNKDLFNDSFRMEIRNKWQANPNYTLPDFEEQIAWDFDGDSIFDTYGNSPKWAYTKPGEYSPQMYLRDSTGFWLRVGLDAPIIVHGADPEIVVDNSSQTFSCTGTPINFSTKTQDTATINAYQWRISPQGPRSSQPEFQWIPSEAGTYTIYLQTEGALGCKQEAAYGPIVIRSPKAGFQITPYQDSCAQLDFNLQNTSTDADTLYWLLNGNVLTKTGASDNTFQLQLPYYGHHFVSQFAVGQLYDSVSNTLKTCTDAYPNEGTIDLNIPGNPNSDFRVLRELSDWGTLVFTALEKNADVYLWTFDGNIRATKADTVWYRNGRNGDYEVCLQVIQGDADCTSKTCKTVWLRDLGFEAPSSEQIRVFPTLIEDHFTIELLTSKHENTSYILQSVSGVKMQQDAIKAKSTSINTSQLPAGTYFLRLEMNNNVQVVKLIKL